MSDRDTIVEAVRSTKNLNQAAKKLGISRKTLYLRMREHGLPFGKAGRRKRRLSYGGKRALWVAAAGTVAAVAIGAVALRSPKSST